MNIDEQVELLMQGTDYGDKEIKKSMTAELRQRLLDAQKELVLCASIAAMTRPPLTCIWAIQLPCVNCASSRNWDMK